MDAPRNFSILSLIADSETNHTNMSLNGASGGHEQGRKKKDQMTDQDIHLKK